MGALRVPTARLQIEAPAGGAAGDVSAVFRTASSWRDVPERTAVLFPSSEGAYGGRSPFVKAMSPLWEPLHYPTLFPAWSEASPPGWTPGYRDDRGRRLTQQDYYASRANDQELWASGRAASEYFCDGWLRIEQERLAHIRHNPALQRRARRTDAEHCEEGGQLPGCVYLPASFSGSHRHQTQQADDAMALAAKWGRPTYFITSRVADFVRGVLRSTHILYRKIAGECVLGETHNKRRAAPENPSPGSVLVPFGFMHPSIGVQRSSRGLPRPTSVSTNVVFVTPH